MHGVWLSTFSSDALRILCLSLVGRWWRAEWETGELLVLFKKMMQTLLSLCGGWSHSYFLTLYMERYKVDLTTKCDIFWYKFVQETTDRWLDYDSLSFTRLLLQSKWHSLHRYWKEISDLLSSLWNSLLSHGTQSRDTGVLNCWQHAP